MDNIAQSVWVVWRKQLVASCFLLFIPLLVSFIQGVQVKEARLKIQDASHIRDYFHQLSGDIAGLQQPISEYIETANDMSYKRYLDKFRILHDDVQNKPLGVERFGSLYFDIEKALIEINKAANQMFIEPPDSTQSRGIGVVATKMLDQLKNKASQLAESQSKEVESKQGTLAVTSELFYIQLVVASMVSSLGILAIILFWPSGEMRAVKSRYAIYRKIKTRLSEKFDKELKECFDEAESNIGQLETELRIEKEKVLEQTEKITALEKDISCLNEQYEELRDEHDVLKGEHVHLLNEKEYRDTELFNIRSRLAKKLWFLRSQVQEWQLKEKVVQEQWEDTRGLLFTFQEQNKILEEVCSGLKVTIKDVRNEIKELRSRMAKRLRKFRGELLASQERLMLEQGLIKGILVESSEGVFEPLEEHLSEIRAGDVSLRLFSDDGKDLQALVDEHQKEIEMLNRQLSEERLSKDNALAELEGMMLLKEKVIQLEDRWEHMKEESTRLLQEKEEKLVRKEEKLLQLNEELQVLNVEIARKKGIEDAVSMRVLALEEKAIDLAVERNEREISLKKVQEEMSLLQGAYSRVEEALKEKEKLLEKACLLERGDEVMDKLLRIIDANKDGVAGLDGVSISQKLDKVHQRISALNESLVIEEN